MKLSVSQSTMETNTKQKHRLINQSLWELCYFLFSDTKQTCFYRQFCNIVVNGASYWIALHFIFIAGVFHVHPVWFYNFSSLNLWYVGIILVLQQMQSLYVHVALWAAVWSPYTANPFQSEIIQWQLPLWKTPDSQRFLFGTAILKSRTCQKITRSTSTTNHGCRFCWFRFSNVTTKASITESIWTWLRLLSWEFRPYVIWDIL